MKTVAVLLLAGALLFAAFAQAQDQKAHVPNPDPTESDMFGSSVAAWDNFFVAGAPGADHDAQDAGLAYLTSIHGDVLVTFHNPAPDSGDHFGAAIAFSENRVLVGAPGDDTFGEDAGAAYLFDALTGDYLAKFYGPNPFAGDRFGHAVAVSVAPGQVVKYLIGAPFAIASVTNATRAGAVYVFDEALGHLMTIEHPEPANEDLFGYALAGDGYKIIVGAPGRDHDAVEPVLINAGAAYVFECHGGTWLASLASPNPTAADSAAGNFGISVAQVAGNPLIGAPLDAVTSNTTNGAAYLFSGAGFHLEVTFNNPSAEAFYFGLTVASAGEDALVGAPWESALALDAGAAYRFDTGANLLQIYQKPNVEESDMFGSALASANGNVVIGVPGDNNGGLVDAGAVCVYFPAPPKAPACLQLPIAAALPDEIVEAPVLVTSDSAFGLAQFVIDYNSTVLRLLDIRLGSAVPNFTLVTRDNLPFGPLHPEADRNILVQVSSASESFTGELQEVAVLRFRVIGALGQKSPLAFDEGIDRTMLTTMHGNDLNNGWLKLLNGRVTVGKLHNVAGAVSYVETALPVPEAAILLYQGEAYFAATSGTLGEYGLWDIPEGEVYMLPVKYEDRNNAITGADALKTLRSVAFLDSLSEGQAFAADVDQNGEVSGADALALLHYLAFFPHSTANSGNWAFIPPAAAFTLLADTTVDFNAALLGDVNLSWYPSWGGGAAPATNGQILLSKGNAAPMTEVKLPTIARSAIPSDGIVSLPITVSSDSALGFVQVVVDYDAAALQFLEAKAGREADGFSLQVNNALPFPAATPGANKNVLVQLSSGTNSVKGQSREVVVLKMKVLDPQRSSVLAFDLAPAHTALTTVHNTDIKGNGLSAINGHVGNPTAVKESNDNQNVPLDFSLEQNYPNPFNPETRIAYAIPGQGSGKVQVSLRIYNVQGQLLRTLVEGEKTAGRYQVMWNGKNEAGALVTSGSYFYTLKAGSFTATKKMVTLK